MSSIPVGSSDLERMVIDEARRQGVESIPVQFNGQEATMCGTCGRLVCHPDCPRGGFSDSRNLRAEESGVYPPRTRLARFLSRLRGQK